MHWINHSHRKHFVTEWCYFSFFSSSIAILCARTKENVRWNTFKLNGIFDGVNSIVRNSVHLYINDVCECSFWCAIDTHRLSTYYLSGINLSQLNGIDRSPNHSQLIECRFFVSSSICSIDDIFVTITQINEQQWLYSSELPLFTYT